MIRLTASEFNEGLAFASSLRLQPGNGIHLHRSERHQLVSLAEEVGRHRHPWFVTPRWFEPTRPKERGTWKYLVTPGFVNGLDPIVPGSAPEKDKPDLGLCEVDWITVNSVRTAGGDGDPIPPYLKSLGASGPDKSITVNLRNFDTVNASQLIKNSQDQRSLCAVDIFVSVARAQLVSDLQVADPTGVSANILLYAPRFNTSRLEQVGARARLLQAPKIPAPPESTALLRFLGLAEDESEDRLLLATLYFLSPKNPTDPIRPDGTWRAYVKQHVFWNLMHSTKNEVPKVIPPRVPFFTGLAGGLGDIIINQYRALQSVLEDQAYRVIARDEVGGRFWSI